MKEKYLKYEEIINYLVVGILTTIVSLSTYYLLRYSVFINNTQINIQISNIISFVLAVLFSYYFNQSWVFKSNKRGREKQKEFISFIISRILTLFLDMICMFIFTYFMHISDKIAKLIVQVIITLANYVIGKFIVFNNK